MNTAIKMLLGATLAIFAAAFIRGPHRETAIEKTLAFESEARARCRQEWTSPHLRISCIDAEMTAEAERIRNTTK